MVIKGATTSTSLEYQQKFISNPKEAYIKIPEDKNNYSVA